MEPQTQGVQSSAPSSGANNSLDPTVVALTKAIGQVESGGNYNAPDKTGDGAGSYGAYQMTPDFLKQWAPKSGIQYQPGQQLTPAQQDEVAYNAVKSMGQQGMTPAQVASAWNTGNPNAYKDPNYGKNNTYGSTQNYVKKIEGYYNQFLGTPTAEAATSPSSQSSQDTSSGGFSPSDLGMGLLGMAGSVLPFLWKYAQKPLTDAATDATIGAAMGAPEGGVGAVPGAVAGAGAGVIQGILGDITGGASGSSSSGDTSGISSTDTSPTDISNTQQQTPGPTSEVPTEAQTLLNEATNQELNRRLGGRNISQSPEGKLGTATMAENGYVPENNNGNADYSSAIAHSVANETQAANMERQSAEGSTVPMAEVISIAQKKIEASNVAPDIKKDTLGALAKISQPYGDGEISGNDAIDARHQQYSAVKKNWNTMGTPEKEARKALGTAFREVSLAHSRNPHLQMAAIFEQQKHISAQKVMKALHNRPLSKQFVHPVRAALYKAAAQLAEAYIGEKIGGPIGAILGYAVGSHINHSLEKRLKKTNFDTPEMKKALVLLRDTKPGAFNHFKEVLKRNGIEMPDIPDKPKTKDNQEKQVEKEMSSVEKYVKKENVSNILSPIRGKSTGFPAKPIKKEPSPALKALMRRGPNPKSQALKNLEKGLPKNKRKGNLSSVRMRR
jgi:hypothetical protein